MEPQDTRQRPQSSPWIPWPVAAPVDVASEGIAASVAPAAGVDYAGIAAVAAVAGYDGEVMAPAVGLQACAEHIEASPCLAEKTSGRAEAVVGVAPTFAVDGESIRTLVEARRQTWTGLTAGA